jgi:hypothetical protein
VADDARRRWSPWHGIMSLLIDHWHLDRWLDVAVTLQRVLLQVIYEAI